MVRRLNMPHFRLPSHMKKLFLSTLLMTLLFAFPLWATELKIYTINVSKGASTLIVSDNGVTNRTMLIDSGINGAPVVSCLQSLGITNLDYTILTHAHDDHYGGFNEITNAGINLGSCYSYTSGTYNGVYFQQIGVYENPSRSGTDMFDLGGGVITRCVVSNGSITGGAYKSVSEENSKSVGILLTYNGFDFIVAGDLGGDSTYGNVETPLANAIYTNNIDVLSVNHHGSAGSSNAYYCYKLKPEVALISVGTSSNSNWNFPTQDCLDHLNDASNTYPDWAGVQHIYVTEHGNGAAPGTAPNMTYENSNIVVSYSGGATYTVTGTTSGTVTYAVDEAGSPTATPTSSPTPTRTPTRTRTPAPSATPTRTPTSLPTDIPAPSPTATPSAVFTPPPPPTPTPLPDTSPTPTLPAPEPIAPTPTPPLVTIELNQESALPGGALSVSAVIKPIDRLADAYLVFQSPRGALYFCSAHGVSADPKAYAYDVRLPQGWSGKVLDMRIPESASPGVYTCYGALFPLGQTPRLDGRATGASLSVK